MLGRGAGCSAGIVIAGLRRAPVRALEPGDAGLGKFILNLHSPPRCLSLESPQELVGNLLEE